MGSGKAIVSTPYWYAAEMLAEERGRLVPFNDPGALAEQVIDLFDNAVEANAMRKRAYLFARDAVWPEVAQQYLRVFAEAREERTRQSGTFFSSRTLKADFADVPELNFDHLRRLTDDTGMLQHATFNVPDLRHGYCTDDNARALILTALAEQAPAGGRDHQSPARHLPGLPAVRARRGDGPASATSCPTTGTGWRRWAPRIARAGRCGAWASPSARPPTRANSAWRPSLFNQAMPTAEHLDSPALLGDVAAGHRRVPASASRETARPSASAGALAERLLARVLRPRDAGAGPGPKTS